MSEEKIEQSEQVEVHPEIAKAQAIAQQATDALLNIINLVKQIPPVVAGNVALSVELEKVKAELASLKGA